MVEKIESKILDIFLPQNQVESISYQPPIWVAMEDMWPLLTYFVAQTEKWSAF